MKKTTKRTYDDEYYDSSSSSEASDDDADANADTDDDAGTFDDVLSVLNDDDDDDDNDDNDLDNHNGNNKSTLEKYRNDTEEAERKEEQKKKTKKKKKNLPKKKPTVNDDATTTIRMATTSTKKKKKKITATTSTSTSTVPTTTTTTKRPPKKTLVMKKIQKHLPRDVAINHSCDNNTNNHYNDNDNPRDSISCLTETTGGRSRTKNTTAIATAAVAVVPSKKIKRTKSDPNKHPAGAATLSSSLSSSASSSPPHVAGSKIRRNSTTTSSRNTSGHSSKSQSTSNSKSKKNHTKPKKLVSLGGRSKNTSSTIDTVSSSYFSNDHPNPNPETTTHDETVINKRVPATDGTSTQVSTPKKKTSLTEKKKKKKKKITARSSINNSKKQKKKKKKKAVISDNDASSSSSSSSSVSISSDDNDEFVYETTIVRSSSISEKKTRSFSPSSSRTTKSQITKNNNNHNHNSNNTQTKTTKKKKAKTRSGTSTSNIQKRTPLRRAYSADGGYCFTKKSKNKSKIHNKSINNKKQQHGSSSSRPSSYSIGTASAITTTQSDRRKATAVRSISADHLDEMKKMTNKNNNKKKSNSNKINDRRVVVVGGGSRGSGGLCSRDSGGRSLHSGHNRPGRGRGPPERRGGVKRHASLPIRGSVPPPPPPPGALLSSNFTPFRYLKRQLSRDHDIDADINNTNNNHSNHKNNNDDGDDATTTTTANRIPLKRRSKWKRSSSEDDVMIKDSRRGARERIRKSTDGGKKMSASLSPTRLLDRPKPQGILRNSSHRHNNNIHNTYKNKSKNHRGSLSAESYHSTTSSSVGFVDEKTNQPVSDHSNLTSKTNTLASIAHGGRSHAVGFSSSVSLLEASDDEFHDKEELEPIKFNDDDGSVTDDDNNTSKEKANDNSRHLMKSSSRSFLGFSNHSYMSNRSQMSIDTLESFGDDPPWKTAMRYMRLLAPHKDESVQKRNIRIFTWTAMALDFIAAMVAVCTYKGATKCCGEDIFDIMLDINWDVLFKFVTSLYLVVVFAEIIPVIKKGVPFNIINPTIGFMITIGMFFDDSVMEAVAMWIIEALAIFFEFLVYRTNAQIFRETNNKLKKIDQDLIDLKKSRRHMFEMSRHNSKHSSRATTSRHSTNNHNTSTSDSEDDDSISGHSFGDSDDDFSLTSSFKSSEHAPAASLPVPNLPRPATVKHVHRMNSRRTHFGLNGTSHSTVSSRGRTAVIPGERKQNKLLRDRRINRQKLKEQEKDLYYHFFGTILNVSLATLAMILIVAIASTVRSLFILGSVLVPFVRL